MGWHVEFSKVGEQDLSVLDRPVRREVVDRVAWLVENFDQVTPIPLHGQWKGFYKLRVNDWRVAYTFNAQKYLIRVEIIDHRSRIYKRLR